MRSSSTDRRAPRRPEGASLETLDAARESTCWRALHRAAVVVGGVTALAAHLCVREADLMIWLQGTAEPPYEAFLAAVEIIVLDLEVR